MAKFDPDDLRRIAITGVISDDQLAANLVLKGGNALRLVHGVSTRASLDLDFSMATDFASLDDAKRRLFHGLRERFDAVGLIVLDTKLTAKPPTPRPEDPMWGGYEAELKLISRERFEEIRDNPQALAREALTIHGPGKSTKLTIDISKYEFVDDMELKEVNGFECRVYSLRLIVAEKLRALAQQMPEAFPPNRRKARARDFFDIFTLCSGKEPTVLRSDFNEILAKTFAAKSVPLDLLGKFGGERALHEPDWPSVRDTSIGAGEEFDPYFNYVVNLADRYKPSGK